MQNFLLETWDALISPTHASADQKAEALHRLLATNAKLTWFDIDLHKACNLTCNHCFYHDNYPKSTRPALAPELLEEAIRQALQARINVLTFSGMEPTLSKNFALAVKSAVAARANNNPEAKIGLITNGLILPLHLDLLEQNPVDFIDVSLDGWEAHNLIRSGTRDRVLANFKLAKERLRATRVGTSTVLRNDNIFDVIAMIEHLAEFSNYFYFEPVVAAVDKSVPSLASSNLLAFVARLRALAEKLAQRDMRFSILLNGDQTLPLFYAGILEPEQIEEDELHSLYIRQCFGKVEIDFILRIVPEYFWRSARLSYDGYWLGTCDLLQAPDYREVASGSFAETPDLQQLFQRSLARDTIFYQMLQDLFENPCGHSSREQQYCLSCFSTRMVKMMHRRYGSPWADVQRAA
ncbi:radical SAM protein [candidate division KSB1 bacterium]|nr:radical SAM protein [candidate division KSB1 bacterium]